jgi:hypothetical protein
MKHLGFVVGRVHAFNAKFLGCDGLGSSIRLNVRIGKQVCATRSLVR